MTRCSTIRDRLEEFAGGTLSPDERCAVEEHLAGCSSCARDLRALALLSRVRPKAPPGYFEGILPRVRERLAAAPAPFRLPAFVLRAVVPAAAAVFGLVVALQLIPLGGGNAAGDAAVMLGQLPESDLAEVAEHHDSEAIITLPAEAPEAVAPDLDESSVLQEIVEAESGAAMAFYLDTDTALANLADDEQSELISMLEQPE